MPENYIQKLNIQFREHMDVYKNYKKNELLFDELKKKQLSNEFLISENNRLRELINESIQSKDIYAKVLIDRDSPYLKSIILNKGSKDNVKLGMAVLDDSYLVGKIIEVNYTNSRVLLLTDLNSNIPVSITPGNVQAIVVGNGDKKSNNQGGKGILGIFFTVLIIGWSISGFYQVDEKEQAVVLRLGKYVDTMGPGLHWNPSLIDKVTKVRVTEERQYSSRGQMLTEDENIVELPITVQYNISDVKAFVLNVKDPELSLKQASDSALRHVVGKKH